MNNNKLLIVASVLVLAILYVVGSSIYKKQESSRIAFLARADVGLFVRDSSPTKGPEDADVILVEYLDPACGSCRAFYPVVKKILADHPGKIKLVVRYAPFHKGSDYVVKALEAARLQGKYWEALEILFQYQRKWASHSNPQLERIWTLLGDLGLDLEKAKTDMNSEEIAAHVQQDIEDGKKLGVRRTPTFFINGKPLEKFGAEELAEAVRSEL